MFSLNKIIPVDSDYKFLNFRINFYIVSGIAIFLSLILLFFKGLNLGIDFKGGTLIEVSTNNSSIGELRDILSPNFNEVSLQEFGDDQTIIIRWRNNAPCSLNGLSNKSCYCFSTFFQNKFF